MGDSLEVQWKAGRGAGLQLRNDEQHCQTGHVARWHGDLSIVDNRGVIVARSLWDKASGTATAEITVVERTDDGELVRSDPTLTQRCTSEWQILHALTTSGFSKITVYEGVQDLGYCSIGRAFFVASGSNTMDTYPLRGVLPPLPSWLRSP